MDAPLRVALPTPAPPHQHISLGADYAARRLIDGLGREPSRVELIHLSPGVPGGVHAYVTQGASVAVHTPEAVRAPWDVLHDVRPVGDPRRVLLARRSWGNSYPISMTLHALCYPQYLDTFFAPLLLANCEPYDAIVCTSNAARDACANLLSIAAEELHKIGVNPVPDFKGSIRVIPLGVDTDLFRPRDGADVRYQLHLPADAFIFLWVGRLSAVTKANLLPLLGAYRDLIVRNPSKPMLLVMVGTDAEGYGRTLEACAEALGIKPAVRVERTSPQTPVHLWFSAADVFVSPVDNVQETFGITPVEAMAAGLPQVVSDWNGHRDTVVHGRTGFLVKTYWADCDDDAVAAWTRWSDGAAAQALLARAVACDTGELTSYLEQLLHSVALRASMGAASRARALSEYAWPVVVERYLTLWAASCAASAGAKKVGPGPRVIIPKLYRAFAGYASHLLAENTPIRLRIEAAGPVAAIDLLGRDTSGAIGGDALSQVLAVLSSQGGAISLAELSLGIAGDGVTRQEVRRAVLVGIKYGLLEPINS